MSGVGPFHGLDWAHGPSPLLGIPDLVAEMRVLCCVVQLNQHLCCLQWPLWPDCTTNGATPGSSETVVHTPAWAMQYRFQTAGVGTVDGTVWPGWSLCTACSWATVPDQLGHTWHLFWPSVLHIVQVSYWLEQPPDWVWWGGWKVKGRNLLAWCGPQTNPTPWVSAAPHVGLIRTRGSSGS